MQPTLCTPMTQLTTIQAAIDEVLTPEGRQEEQHRAGFHGGCLKVLVFHRLKSGFDKNC